MTALQVSWFVVLVLFVTAYAILDGFDLGIGILYTIAGRNHEQREKLHDTISPVWDGNEVWLVLVGGLVFAVFPVVYATVLSGLYLFFILALTGLILRSGALGLYYSRVPHNRRWVLAFSGGSILAGFFLGLAAGDLIRGVALGADGEFAGSIGGLFHPFAIAAALYALVLFANQGAAWAALKTTGEAHEIARTARWRTGWTLLGAFALLTLLAVFLAPDHVRSLAGRPLGWVMVALVLGGIAAKQVFGRRGNDLPAFLAACASVVGSVGIWAVGVYPALVPAANDASNSLTIASAAAPRDSLVAMVVVAAIGIPLAAICFTVAYRTFRGRHGADHEGY